MILRKPTTGEVIGAGFLALCFFGNAQCRHPAAIQISSVCYIPADPALRAQAAEFKASLRKWFP